MGGKVVAISTPPGTKKDYRIGKTPVLVLSFYKYPYPAKVKDGGSPSIARVQSPLIRRGKSSSGSRHRNNGPHYPFPIARVRAGKGQLPNPVIWESGLREKFLRRLPPPAHISYDWVHEDGQEEPDMGKALS